MLTRTSGKHLEDFSHAHTVSLFYKLITSAGDTDSLSIGFDRDCGRRQRELIIDKNINDKYCVRTMLRDVFGLSEY